MKYIVLGHVEHPEGNYSDTLGTFECRKQAEHFKEEQEKPLMTGYSWFEVKEQE